MEIVSFVLPILHLMEKLKGMMHKSPAKKVLAYSSSKQIARPFSFKIQTNRASLPSIVVGGEVLPISSTQPSRKCRAAIKLILLISWR